MCYPTPTISLESLFPTGCSRDGLCCQLDALIVHVRIFGPWGLRLYAILLREKQVTSQWLSHKISNNSSKFFHCISSDNFLLSNKCCRYCEQSVPEVSNGIQKCGFKSNLCGAVSSHISPYDKLAECYNSCYWLGLPLSTNYANLIMIKFIGILSSWFCHVDWLIKCKPCTSINAYRSVASSG